MCVGPHIGVEAGGQPQESDLSLHLWSWVLCQVGGQASLIAEPSSWLKRGILSLKLFLRLLPSLLGPLLEVLPGDFTD